MRCSSGAPRVQRTTGVMYDVTSVLARTFTVSGLFFAVKNLAAVINGMVRSHFARVTVPSEREAVIITVSSVKERASWSDHSRQGMLPCFGYAWQGPAQAAREASSDTSDSSAFSIQRFVRTPCVRSPIFYRGRCPARDKVLAGRYRIKSGTFHFKCVAGYLGHSSPRSQMGSSPFRCR